MIAEVLSKYLKKVKEFANEKSSFEICKNVKIKGDAKEIVMWCCDGDSGIRQVIPNKHGTPLIGEFCINVFDFSEIINNILPRNSDILFKLNTDNYRLNVKTESTKFPVKAQPPDKIFALEEHKEWNEVDGTFFDRLKNVVPLCLHENYPIVYDSDSIYYASPHAIIFTPLVSKMPVFKIDIKVAKKIFIDLFDKADANDSHVFFSNENCEIYIPQINTKATLIKPISDKVKLHNIVVDVNTAELNAAFSIIKSLHKRNGYDTRAVQLIFEKNTLLLKYEESECIIADVKYTYPTKMVIKIPFDHLQVITSTEFIRDATYVKILLAENNTMFVSQKGLHLTFVGGLSR